ncbi:MAG: hypothetical protein JO300_07830 [Silvibacterium sp.]|nr:hypothetical protein [Silvibacterium sp.]MBV8436771.1 hypothetical protein [Silvibacterium sp.]
MSARKGGKQVRPWAAVLCGVVCLGAAACRSAFIETTVQNDGTTPVHLIEVDYPSASFGMQTLDAHASYHYHFKVQGSGAVTITFLDNAGKPHTATGPTLTQGQQGNLKITIDPSASVSWGGGLSSGGR